VFFELCDIRSINIMINVSWHISSALKTVMPMLTIYCTYYKMWWNDHTWKSQRDSVHRAGRFLALINNSVILCHNWHTWVSFCHRKVSEKLVNILCHQLKVYVTPFQQSWLTSSI
jgi:hypothetical protein